MTQLITIEETTLGQTANSREVYNFLKIDTPYSMWIKRTIERFDFVEGEDFTINKFVIGKATQIDYIVTMDMAKELCMITNTPKGKETRKYFIAAEKQAHTNKKPMSTIDMIISMAQETKKQEERLIILEDKVDNLTLNKDVMPRAGYFSITSLQTKLGFSHNMVKLFIERKAPKSVQCMKTLPDGSAKPYTAFKLKPLLKFSNQVRDTAYPIGTSYFRSPLLGSKKFTIGK